MHNRTRKSLCFAVGSAREPCLTLAYAQHTTEGCYEGVLQWPHRGCVDHTQLPIVLECTRPTTKYWHPIKVAIHLQAVVHLGLWGRDLRKWLRKWPSEWLREWLAQ